jgi:hypothetical protein
VASGSATSYEGEQDGCKAHAQEIFIFLTLPRMKIFPQIMKSKQNRYREI